MLALTSSLLLLAAGAAATAGAAPAHASPTVEVCTNQGGSSQCMNRKGGIDDPGTPVIGWSAGDDNNGFQFVHLTGMCNDGYVSASGECPFTPGGGLNAKFNGDPIMEIQDLSNGSLCVGTTSNGSAELTLCPTSSGTGGGDGVIDVMTSVPDDTAIINRFWSDNDSCGSGKAPCGACVFSHGSVVLLSNLFIPYPPSSYCLWNELGV